mmetsp:Transcript_52799/g.104902  ORF Transcript_52799/g.104902 Transcript_52799/m.104902 type:complete len:129 (+) Transcript_52799:461-847(+)
MGRSVSRRSATRILVQQRLGVWIANGANGQTGVPARIVEVNASVIDLLTGDQTAVASSVNQGVPWRPQTAQSLARRCGSALGRTGPHLLDAMAVGRLPPCAADPWVPRIMQVGTSSVASKMPGVLASS